MERLLEYESATKELCEFLDRDDFRVMWNPKTQKYEVQQYIPGGWDEIPLMTDEGLVHLFYPCYFWSTILITPVWHAGIKKDIHWGLVVSAKEIVRRIEEREEEIRRDEDRRIEDASYETAKWMVQATDHRKIYST